MPILVLFVLALHGCNTGVEPSPAPGILRVKIVSDDLDTALVSGGDTTRFTRWDSFEVTFAQGALYRNENYANIYVDPSSDRISTSTVNLIGRHWLDGTKITGTDTTTITTTNSRYNEYIIFQSYVPPGDYDRVQFSVLSSGISVFSPKIYWVPIQLPDSTSPIMKLYKSISVEEGRTTEVKIEIQPFASLRRYKDAFVFDRKMRIVNVTVL